jgi:hypothetical protein
MKIPQASLLFGAAVLGACGGMAPRGNGVVIPYENGRYVATASAKTEETALRDSLAAAKDECAGRRQPLAVVKQKTEYKGVVAREIVKTAEQIEDIIAAGAGRVLPDLSSDEDYKVSLEFRCGG